MIKLTEEDRLKERNAGKSEGKIEGKIEAAINLLKLGISEDIIMKATGVSKEKMNDLLKTV